MIGAHGGLLEGAVHAFDMAIGPRMVGLGETMVDLMASAGELEGVGAKKLSALASESDFGGG